ADRGIERHRLAHSRRRRYRRHPDHRQRGRADEIVGVDRFLLFDAERTIRGRMGGARMIYDVRQTTSYSYASKVAFAHHVLRLTPTNRTRQRVHAAALEIEPRPVERGEARDFFGNHLTWIELNEPHDRLIVTAIARVKVDAIDEPAPLAPPPWEELRARA